MTNSPPPGTKLCIDRLEATGDFVVEVTGAQETLFNGELFQLLFKFSERYPFESPQVSAEQSVAVYEVYLLQNSSVLVVAL